uniref:Glutamate-ammonia ligase n=1 Tax=Solanum tuberosum TaxID=4113 RepID=M1BN23_SOLTU
MRGIHLDQSYGLLAPSVRGGAFSVAGAISGVQVEVGHEPFYAYACRSEVMALGAKKAREVVFNVLWDACVHDDLSITEALAIVKAIFAENAKQFYKLDASSRYSDVEPQSLLSPFKKEELNGPLTDVTAVRVIWLDFSAQHRCRVSFTLCFYLYKDYKLLNDKFSTAYNYPNLFST